MVSNTNTEHNRLLYSKKTPKNEGNLTTYNSPRNQTDEGGRELLTNENSSSVSKTERKFYAENGGLLIKQAS